MKKSHFIIYRKHNLSAILLLLVVILNVSNVFGSKPKIHFSSSAVYPRLSMIDSEENLHWRSLLSYDQSFGKNIDVDALFEYGSENDHFQNITFIISKLKLW